ncbi:MAG: hypothetical protein JW811_07990 [Clostridiales bacterium]|nr:hypothetical protein [Clostridiales bacterium]
MKRMVFRIAALGLVMLLCTGAAAQTADDVSYTMDEKLIKQLSYGSGFQGTLTITADAVEGRESEAFSTITPLVFDVTYIKPGGDEAVSQESRLTLSLDGSDYQEGSAEFSLRDGAVYMRSSLLKDGWYLLDGDITDLLLDNIGVQDALPAASELTQAGGLMPGTLSFFTGIAYYLPGANTDSMTAATQDYLTKIDFWLEGYREGVQMTVLDDGTSGMEISYRIPAAAVKSQLKQMIVDLMNDEALLNNLTAVMPEEQAALYLDPELQPYYFYAVDELPVEDELTIHRVMSLLGETVELSVVMPLYDSVSGAATLTYTSTQGGEDMPYENALSLMSADGYLEVNFRTYETMNGTTVYQGTILREAAKENGVNPPVYWAVFDLSILIQTTKDLRGYETQYQTVRLSVAPAEVPAAQDASQYAVFTKTDLALDMKFASLAAKNSPTNTDITLTVSGDDMAQTVSIKLSGVTTGQWTPEAFEAAQAVSLAQMPPEELQSLLSQAVIKGGLLFLPYVNLPQIAADPAD